MFDPTLRQSMKSAALGPLTIDETKEFLRQPFAEADPVTAMRFTLMLKMGGGIRDMVMQMHPDVQWWSGAIAELDGLDGEFESQPLAIMAMLMFKAGKIDLGKQFVYKALSADNENEFALLLMRVMDSGIDMPFQEIWDRLNDAVLGKAADWDTHINEFRAQSQDWKDITAA